MAKTKRVVKKRIPISALRLFAKLQGLDVAILLGWCQENNLQHVVTWGRTADMCDSAALMGNKVKELAGWPPEECNAEPSRVKKLKEENARLKERIKELDEQLEWVAREMGEQDEMREAAERELDEEIEQLEQAE